MSFRRKENFVCEIDEKEIRADFDVDELVDKKLEVEKRKDVVVLCELEVVNMFWEFGGWWEGEGFYEINGGKALEDIGDCW